MTPATAVDFEVVDVPSSVAERKGHCRKAKRGKLEKAGLTVKREDFVSS